MQHEHSTLSILSAYNGRLHRIGDGNGSWWWLRSPGFEQNDAANVGDYGSINKAGHKVFDDDVVNGGVRPVIHITVK